MSYSTHNSYSSLDRPAAQATGEYKTTVTLSNLMAFDGGVAIDLSPVTGHEVVPFEMIAEFVDAVWAYRERESVAAEHQRLKDAFAAARGAFHKAEADYQDARTYRNDANDVYSAAADALEAFESLHNLL